MIFDRQLGSRYVLGPLLGSGSMGRVRHAKRLADGAPLAVNLLRDEWSGDDEIIARLLREKRLLNAPDHPYVLKVFDLVVEGGRVAIVMETVAGGDLRQLVGPAATHARRVARRSARRPRSRRRAGR